MRRLLSLMGFAAAVGCLSASPCRADDAPTFADRVDDEADVVNRTFSLMLNPLAAAHGLFGCEAAFVVSPRVAVSFEGDAYSTGSDVATALAVGLFVYPLRTTFHGLYVAPRFVIARPLREPPTRVSWSTDVLAFGATAGWQWTWDYGFSVRLGAGGVTAIAGRFGQGGEGGPGGAVADGRLALALDASMGWAF